MNKVEYSEQPDRILYIPQEDESAEVWLRKDIELVTHKDGELTWQIWEANEVQFNTYLSQSEVEAQFDSYFAEEYPQTTIEDLVEALNIMEDIILGGGL